MTNGQIIFLAILGAMLLPVIEVGSVLVILLAVTNKRLERILVPLAEKTKTVEQKPEAQAAFSLLEQACKEKELDILVGKYPEFDLFSVIQQEQDVVPLAKHLLDLTDDYSLTPLEGDKRENQIAFLSAILSFFHEHIRHSDQSLCNVFYFLQAEKQELEGLYGESSLWQALPPGNSGIRRAFDAVATEDEFCHQQFRFFRRQVGRDYGEIVLDSLDRLRIFCPDVPVLTS